MPRMSKPAAGNHAKAGRFQASHARNAPPISAKHPSDVAELIPFLLIVPMNGAVTLTHGRNAAMAAMPPATYSTMIRLRGVIALLGAGCGATTARPGGAVSGGYHFPSDAIHQLGSCGRCSIGPP